MGNCNTLLSDIVDVHDVHDVEVDIKAVLQFFDVFYDHALILFFTEKLPYINWIKQWLKTIVSPSRVIDEDYHALSKQECPIWVTMDCKHVFLWPLLPKLMS